MKEINLDYLEFKNMCNFTNKTEQDKKRLELIYKKSIELYKEKLNKTSSLPLETNPKSTFSLFSNFPVNKPNV